MTKKKEEPEEKQPCICLDKATGLGYISLTGEETEDTDLRINLSEKNVLNFISEWALATMAFKKTSALIFNNKDKRIRTIKIIRLNESTNIAVDEETYYNEAMEKIAEKAGAKPKSKKKAAPVEEPAADDMDDIM